MNEYLRHGAHERGRKKTRREEKSMKQINKREKNETFVLLLDDQLIVSYKCFIFFFFFFNLIEIPNERMGMVLACKKFEEKKKSIFLRMFDTTAIFN